MRKQRVDSEWPQEGGKKGASRVMPDGCLPLQRIGVDEHREECMSQDMNSGGTAGVYIASVLKF